MQEKLRSEPGSIETSRTGDPETPRDSLLPAHWLLISCLFFLSAIFSLSNWHTLYSYTYESITREDLGKLPGKIQITWWMLLQSERMISATYITLTRGQETARLEPCTLLVWGKAVPSSKWGVIAGRRSM